MVALGGAPRPEHRGRRQWLWDIWLFLGCLTVVVVGIVGGLVLVADVLARVVGGLAP